MVPLQAAAAQPGARARIALYRVRAAPASTCGRAGSSPGSRRVYEMLCGNEHWSTSAGSFRADARGRVEVKLTTAARVGEYDRVRVVTKDRDGHTSDVLTGTLF